jgi:multisubunit Na+/H+ antiporter MnhB subunit
MTEPEPQPRLSEDEEREIRRYAPPGVEVPPPDPGAAAAPIEPRPPIVSSLGLWWLLAIGLVIALLFVATDHMWRAGASFACSMWLAAAIRAFYPDERAGGLVVRSRWLDVTMLVVGGILVAVSAFTLDLRDLR